MSHLIKLSLLTLLFSCSNNSTKQNTKASISNIELEIINTVLPSLMQKDYPCMLAVIENESPESYDLRLQEFYREIDSVGMRILITKKLVHVDSLFLHNRENFHDTSALQLLAKAEAKEKLIDQSIISNPIDRKVQFVNKVRLDESDCYTSGQFTFSRVGFNSDSTEAAFIFNIRTGYHGFNDGVVKVKRTGKGKWQIIK